METAGRLKRGKAELLRPLPLPNSLLDRSPVPPAKAGLVLQTLRSTALQITHGENGRRLQENAQFLTQTTLPDRHTGSPAVRFVRHSSSHVVPHHEANRPNSFV